MGPLAAPADDICAELLQPLRRPPAHPLVWPPTAARASCPPRPWSRRWHGQEARAILAGAAAHSMLPLTAVPTGGIGLMLVTLAHGVGWPVVDGRQRPDHRRDGRRRARRGRHHRDRPLGPLPGRAAAGRRRPARRLPAVAGRAGRRPAARPVPRRAAPVPLRPGRVQGRLRPVRTRCPGPTEDCRRAGTLHLGGTVRGGGRGRGRRGRGQAPARSPYVLAVQPGVADPTRAPAGRHTLWTYYARARRIRRRHDRPRSRRRSSASRPASAT